MTWMKYLNYFFSKVGLNSIHELGFIEIEKNLFEFDPNCKITFIGLFKTIRIALQELETRATAFNKTTDSIEAKQQLENSINKIKCTGSVLMHEPF